MSIAYTVLAKDVPLSAKVHVDQSHKYILMNSRILNLKDLEWKNLDSLRDLKFLRQTIRGHWITEYRYNPFLWSIRYSEAPDLVGFGIWDVPREKAVIKHNTIGPGVHEATVIPLMNGLLITEWGTFDLYSHDLFSRNAKYHGSCSTCGTHEKLSLSPNHSMAAKFGNTYKVYMYNILKGGKSHRVFEEHEGDVSAVAFSNDAKHAASLSRIDMSIKYWNVDTFKVINSWEFPDSARFSRNNSANYHMNVYDSYIIIKVQEVCSWDYSHAYNFILDLKSCVIKEGVPKGNFIINNLSRYGGKVYWPDGSVSEPESKWGGIVQHFIFEEKQKIITLTEDKVLRMW